MSRVTQVKTNVSKCQSLVDSDLPQRFEQHHSRNALHTIGVTQAEVKLSVHRRVTSLDEQRSNKAFTASSTDGLINFQNRSLNSIIPIRPFPFLLTAQLDQTVTDGRTASVGNELRAPPHNRMDRAHFSTGAHIQRTAIATNKKCKATHIGQ